VNARPDRSVAEALDRDDPLHEYRAAFHIPKDPDGRDLIYFAGNSLGLQPAGTRHEVHRVLEAWRDLGVEGHFHGADPWLSYPERITAPTARIVGALPREVVVMNALTVNLHLMLVSFYRPAGRRWRILMEGSPFPSDLYAAASQASFHGLDPAEAILEAHPRPGETTLRTDDLEALIEREGATIALILIGGVNYYTGQAFDMDRITRAGHAQGCVVGLDLAHAAGNIPLQLHEWGVDFAVWCSYKYLNAGPGSPGGCFIHERHHASNALPRFAGWWGEEREKRFRMTPRFEPAPGAEGWQVSNPPMLMLAAYRASVELFERASMERLREKSVKLTSYLESLLDGLPGEAFSVITPRVPGHRGAQLSLFMKRDGRRVFEALLEGGVLCDWREPNVIRVAPVPLYNTFCEVYDFARLFSSLL